MVGGCGVCRQFAEVWLCVQEGVVSSGNSLDYCQQDWDQMVASSAAIKEMEAAGIAWVSKSSVAIPPSSYWAPFAWSDMSAASGLH